MKKKKHEFKILMGVILGLCMMFTPTAVITSCAAISSKPVAGQSNTYHYSGSATAWTVPASGYYSITVAGAKGGAANEHSTQGNCESGSNGYVSIGTFLIMKGTVLNIYPAGRGGDGYVKIEDYASHGGSGGYPNGGGGGCYDAIHSDHSPVGTSGGGGGGSRIDANGTTIIEAQGGKGGSLTDCRYSIYNQTGGKGGGSNAYRNASGVTYNSGWSNYVGNGGDGYVSITYVRPYYEFSTNPRTQTVKEYSSFFLDVETTESPSSYQWQFSTNGGNSWNNIADNEVYQGSRSKKLNINKIPFGCNGYLYRCCTVYDGKTYNSNAAAITVESGLLFDVQPQNTSRIEEQDIILTASSSYADTYGKYQWQRKEPGGVWVDIIDTDKYSGVNTPNLEWECVLDDNNAIYRCVISTMDGIRIKESNPATVTIVKKDFNKILAQYNQNIEYGDSLDINDVYVSVQYTNGKVDFASGWKNLYYLIDGERKRVFTPDRLGTQTLKVIFVDDTGPDAEKVYEAKLNVTVADTTAPVITKCDVSEHGVVNDPSAVQTVTVAAQAEDLYTTSDQLLYALVDSGRVPIASDWVRPAGSSEAVFELMLNQNKEYILYVKDENDNVGKEKVSIMVLDSNAPVIHDVYLLMTEHEWYSYNVLKIDATDDYLPEKIQYRIALTEEELTKREWTLENEFYIDQNGTYIIEIKDSVGNKTRTTYQVTNIDAIAPTVEGTMEYDHATDSFHLSAMISDADSGLYSYQKMKEPLVYLGDVTMEESVYQVDFAPVPYDDFKNAIVLEVTDKAGNTNFYSFIKNEDDYQAPSVSLTRVTQETGEWLDHVIIKATYSLDRGSLTSKPYSFVKWDGDTPPSTGKWTTNSTYSVTASGKYRCYVKTTSGAVGYADIIISDVDANPPEIAFEAMTWDWKNRTAVLHYTVTDTDSGIDTITMQADSLEGNKTYEEYYGMAMAEIEEEVTLYANMVYSLYAYDIAGHESTYRVSCNSSGQLVNNSVTVMFLDYDDTLLDTQIISQGGNATAPAQPERNGYVFKGWDASLVNIQEDITIRAVYVTARSSVYTVTFKDYNDVILKTETVEAGKAATPPENPVREGYTFCGWNDSYHNVIKDVTCTAIYQSRGDGSGNGGGLATGTNKSEKEDEGKDDKYTVMFKDYDGVILKTQTVKHGKDASAPEDPVREGYLFRGWNDSYRDITEDTVCTAVYEKKTSEGENVPELSKTGTETVSGNTGGGKSMYGGGGGTTSLLQEDIPEEEQEEEPDETKYISVSMMPVRAGELAVDNEEYGVLAQDADEEAVVVETNTRVETVTQEQEAPGNDALGFWLVVIGLAGMAGFTVFYNLNRKHMWVKLPDIPVLNFDLPFSS